MKKRKNPQQEAQAIESLYNERKLFDAEFPTDADCVDVLHAIGSAGRKLDCRKKCPNRTWHRLDARTVQCSICRQRVSLTAGTFFDGIKLVREWLFAVWLINKRVEVNPHRFSTVANVSYGTAWIMFKKIVMSMSQWMLNTTGGALIQSSAFVGLMTRRSIETPARQSAASEADGGDVRSPFLQEDSDANDSLVEISIGLDSQIELSDTERNIVNELTDEPVAIDVLQERTGIEVGVLASALVLLEASGIAQRLPSQRYVRVGGVREEDAGRSADVRLSDDVRRKVNNAIEFIQLQFQGISRKYLQHYICLYSYFAESVRWPEGTLLESCIAADAITKADIRNYVSPPLIAIL